MPTYRNDGIATYKVTDFNGDIVKVKPEETVELLDNLGILDFTQIGDTPAIEITVDEMPGAEGTFTSPVKVKGSGELNLSISGMSQDPGNATSVTLQRRFGSSGEWRDVSTFEGDIETSVYDSDSDTYYRLGVKYPNYTFSVSLRLAPTQ